MKNLENEKNDLEASLNETNRKLSELEIEEKVNLAKLFRKLANSTFNSLECKQRI